MPLRTKPSTPRRSRLRALVGESVFGLDEDTMESVVGQLLVGRGWSLGLAESLTGGLVAARIVGVPGASEWFRGAVVAYDTEVKLAVLGVREGPVVSREAAAAMAEGARQVLGADVGLATTGVAGPSEQEGRPVGTVVVGLALPGSVPGCGRVTPARRSGTGPAAGHDLGPEHPAPSALHKRIRDYEQVL